MRIEKISGNKIKITVTQDDMMSWGISIESITDDPSEVHEWFWHILKQAESQADFDIENSQLMVEAMQGKNDEIVLFLTRLGEEETEKLKTRKGRYRVKQPVQAKEEHSLLYSFESFDHLCKFSKEWESRGETSSLYSYDGRYYLFMSWEKNMCNEEAIHSFVSEFADRVPLSVQNTAFLEEHGKVICQENAIEIIKNKF